MIGKTGSPLKTDERGRVAPTKANIFEKKHPKTKFSELSTSDKKMVLVYACPKPVSGVSYPKNGFEFIKPIS